MLVAESPEELVGSTGPRDHLSREREPTAPGAPGCQLPSADRTGQSPFGERLEPALHGQPAPAFGEAVGVGTMSGTCSTGGRRTSGGAGGRPVRRPPTGRPPARHAGRSRCPRRRSRRSPRRSPRQPPGGAVSAKDSDQKRRRSSAAAPRRGREPDGPGAGGQAARSRRRGTVGAAVGQVAHGPPAAGARGGAATRRRGTVEQAGPGMQSTSSSTRRSAPAVEGQDAEVAGRGERQVDRPEVEDAGPLGERAGGHDASTAGSSMATTTRASGSRSPRAGSPAGARGARGARARW